MKLKGQTSSLPLRISGFIPPFTIAPPMLACDLEPLST
jgi:hypothetical protein